MCFECSNRTLNLVATVNFWRYFLMCALPYICDDFNVGCTGFVVQDLRVDRDATSFETLHDGLVGWDAMVVLFGLEWLYQYKISRIMVGEHNVLVTTHCTDWVAPKVVSEQCCKRYLPEDDCVGRCYHGVK